MDVRLEILNLVSNHFVLTSLPDRSRLVYKYHCYDTNVDYYFDTEKFYLKCGTKMDRYRKYPHNLSLMCFGGDLQKLNFIKRILKSDIRDSKIDTIINERSYKSKKVYANRK